MLATYKNKTPWIKIIRNALHDQHFIWASPLAADQNKTSNLKINRTLPQDASTYMQPTNKSIIKTIQPSPILSNAKSRVIALAIKRHLPKQRPLQ